MGKLVYLNVTHPDIAFPVHVLTQFLASPTIDHLQAANRVLRYIKSTPAQGLLYPANASLRLEGFCDADWASFPISRRSTSEYRSTAHTCCELVWIAAILKELRINVSTLIALYCDNKATNHIARNLVFHERTKHIKLDCHLVRRHFTAGLISPQFLGSSD
ncbi:unnamed protein product [Rhodiola kirilowii]